MIRGTVIGDTALTETAEEALAALARDLVEEIAAGRALELAQADPGAIELAQVHGYERFEHGREETVRPYQDTRQPGGWIPQADWLKGQETWKANEWKPKTGAAAVHPQLHHGTVRLPGDTISGHAHAHVPKPFEVKPPDARDKTIAELHQTLAVHRQADAQQIAEEQAAAEAARTGIPAPGTYVPLTDEQFETHTRNVEHAVKQAIGEGLATDVQHTLDGRGRIWTPDRSMAHRDIVKDYLDKQVEVPSQRAALFMGGLPGAGKSTLLKQHPDIDLKDYAAVNPDDFKEELARRGMVPEVEGLSPMERAALVHEESVHLANLAAIELQRRGKNLAYDVTMKSYRQTRNRIGWLKDHGYHVTAVFVDVPVEKSAQRVAKRYRSGLEAYRQGKNPLGGRYVPDYIIRAGEAEPGVSRSRRTFDSLRPKFDRWELYDGTKGVAKLAEKSGPPPQRGIASVEDLIKAGAGKPYVGNTEQEARAAEKGVSAGG